MIGGSIFLVAMSLSNIDKFKSLLFDAAKYAPKELTPLFRKIPELKKRIKSALFLLALTADIPDPTLTPTNFVPFLTLFNNCE